MRPLLALLLLAGCAAEAPFSLEDCGTTCGDGPFWLVDQLAFVLEDDSGLGGFDLDDRLEDCGVTDGISPEGTEGVDNQLGAIWDVLPDSAVAVIPLAIDTSLESGAMMVVLEQVGDEPQALVFREGTGTPLTSPLGVPLAGQTIDLLPDDNLLGTAGFVEPTADGLTVGDVDLLLKPEWIDTQVELQVVRGQGQLLDDGDGGLDLYLGGMVPMAAVLDVVGGLGGDGDDGVREILEAMLPLVVDVRTDPEGECDGLSGTFRGHAVPVYLYE
jgi:hypothetical protein